MNAQAILQVLQPFLMVALLIIVTFIAASSINNNHMGKRVDNVGKHIDRVEAKLENHDQRLTSLIANVLLS